MHKANPVILSSKLPARCLATRERAGLSWRWSRPRCTEKRARWTTNSRAIIALLPLVAVLALAQDLSGGDLLSAEVPPGDQASSPASDCAREHASFLAEYSALISTFRHQDALARAAGLGTLAQRIDALQETARLMIEAAPPECGRPQPSTESDSRAAALQQMEWDYDPSEITLLAMPFGLCPELRRYIITGSQEARRRKDVADLAKSHIELKLLLSTRPHSYQVGVRLKLLKKYSDTAADYAIRGFLMRLKGAPKECAYEQPYWSDASLQLLELRRLLNPRYPR